MTVQTPKNVDTLENARLYYNESLRTLVSHFSGSAAPTSSDYVLQGAATTLPVGALWYDTSNSVVRVQTSVGTWKQAFIPQVNSPSGSNFSEGELVYDTVSDTLKLKDASSLKTVLTEGAAIDGTAIGSTTPSTGDFTSLSASSTASFTSISETTSSVSSSSGALTIDLSNGTYFTLTLSENITSTSFNTAGSGVNSFVLRVTQGASNYTITWSNVVWPSGVAPTLSSGSGDIDVFVFFNDGGSDWYGFVAGQDML